MKPKTFMIYAAAVPLLFGSVYMFTSKFALGLFGLDNPDGSHLFFMQTAGGLMLAMAAFNWLIRSSIGINAVFRSVLAANIVMHVFQGALDFQSAWQGTFNGLAYSGTAIHVVMIAGCVYYLRHSESTTVAA